MRIHRQLIPATLSIFALTLLSACANTTKQSSKPAPSHTPWQSSAPAQAGEGDAVESVEEEAGKDVNKGQGTISPLIWDLPAREQAFKLEPYQSLTLESEGVYAVKNYANKLLEIDLIGKVYALDAEGNARRLYKARSTFDEGETLHVIFDDSVLQGADDPHMDVQRDQIVYPGITSLNTTNEAYKYDVIEKVRDFPVTKLDAGVVSEEVLAAITRVESLKTLRFVEPHSYDSHRYQALTLDLIPYFKKLTKLERLMYWLPEGQELDPAIKAALAEALPQTEIAQLKSR